MLKFKNMTVVRKYYIRLFVFLAWIFTLNKNFC